MSKSEHVAREDDGEASARGTACQKPGNAIVTPLRMARLFSAGPRARGVTEDGKPLLSHLRLRRANRSPLMEATVSL
jgi:hypothetical protein